MLLKEFCYNYLMVKSTKKIIDSLQIHGYTYNELYNNMGLNLIQQLRLCKKQSEKIAERRYK